MRHRRSVATAVALVLTAIAVVAGGSAASADKIDPRTADEKFHIGPNSSVGAAISAQSLTQTPSTSGGLAALDVQFSPAGCKGQTDYPHQSGSEASVHGRTHCDVIVHVVTVTTTLKRERWYGMQQLDQRTASRGGGTSNDSGDATPHWNCAGAGEYSYHGYSTHESVEGTGTYSATTENFNLSFSRFVC